MCEGLFTDIVAGGKLTALLSIEYLDCGPLACQKKLKPKSFNSFAVNFVCCLLQAAQFVCAFVVMPLYIYVKERLKVHVAVFIKNV